MNGSLLPARNNNHDKLLKQFCRRHQLRHTINNTNCLTFHHHNGNSNSQIDYILENIQSNILLDTKIEDQHQLNGSAHVPVRTKTTLVISLNKSQDKKQKHKIILKWEETNIPSYQNAIEKAVLENLSNNSDVDIQAEDIINLIVTTNKTNVTNKTVTLKGPSWKASPPVKELISENKRAFYNWKQIGRPKDENSIEYIEMKRCKRQLRNQIRREEHEYKLNFYNNLMDKPDSKTCFRLIRKNKASSDETAAMVIKGDQNQDVSDHKEQADLFAQFYESLAIPSNEEHFDNDHLEDCEYRYSLINNIVQHTANESINTKFNEEDIHLSIGKLNTGKTSDGCTLTAEHFKYAGENIVPSIVNLFSKIIQSGKIPKVFKTGILTPIHKKGKDPTLTTNYRGITVTSVLGNFFEYA